MSAARSMGRGARYWIDGYNVVLRLKLGAGQPMQERRDELIARVAATGHEAWIAFDSSESHPGLGSSTPRRVTIAFARPGSSADALLIDKVRRAADLDGVVIVSDDREITQRCGFMGARTMSTAEFARTLKPAAPATPQKERPLTKTEVADWMKWFGQSGSPDSKEK